MYGYGNIIVNALFMFFCVGVAVGAIGIELLLWLVRHFSISIGFHW